MKQVFKVAKVGSDAGRCADYNLLFDNRWPVMKIFAQGEATIMDAGSSGSSLIYTHNLGYFPAFMVFVVDANGSALPSVEVSNSVRITETELSWYHIGNNLGSVTMYFYIFLNNLESAIDGTDINFISSEPGVQSSDSRMEAAKPDYSVASLPKDKILSSSHPSFVIHRVDVGTKGTFPDDYPLAVNHALGYFPMYMIFGKGGDLGGEQYRNISPPSFDHFVWINDSVLNVWDTYSYDYSIFIFKNPAGF